MAVEAGSTLNDAATLLEDVAAMPGDKPGMGSLLRGAAKKHRNLGYTALAALVMSRLMGLPSEIGERKLRRGALRQQAETLTPERLYYEAALPQAQAEEDMARQALLSQLSGGVLGPSLARGERRIGG